MEKDFVLLVLFISAFVIFIVGTIQFNVSYEIELFILRRVFIE